MKLSHSRLGLLLFFGLLCALAASRVGMPMLRAQARIQSETIPPLAPSLQQGGFECDDSLRLTPWHIRYLTGTPFVQFTRERANGSCAGWVDRLEGNDSLIVVSEDIESLPEPGKPFDAVLYQPISTTVGGDYSVSVWMVSFCGGSNQPNDCPPGFYIIKMAGLDPTGGFEPTGDQVVWTEDNRNWVDSAGKPVGWVNLRTAATASAETMTVFLRMRSPWQWHGNHGLIDAVSVVRAPIASFVDLPSVVTSTITGSVTIPIQWSGTQSPDVVAMPGGRYSLLFDLQVRPVGSLIWRSLLEGATDITQTTFQPRCTDTVYEFRLRARAEQIGDLPGAFPNHRYPGVWTPPVAVQVKQPEPPATQPIGPYQQFLPIVQHQVTC